jgi:hypothetical protein
MFTRTTLFVSLGLLVTACAGGAPPEPPAPAPIDPAGTYDIVVVAEGMEVTGVMVIRGSAEAGYTGNIDTDMGGAAIYDIEVEGDTLRFSIPDAGMTAEVVFEGMEFTGWLAGDMGDASVQGVKRSGEVSLVG